MKLSQRIQKRETMDQNSEPTNSCIYENLVYVKKYCIPMREKHKVLGLAVKIPDSQTVVSGFASWLQRVTTKKLDSCFQIHNKFVTLVKKAFNT